MKTNEKLTKFGAAGMVLVAGLTLGNCAQPTNGGNEIPNNGNGTENPIGEKINDVKFPSLYGAISQGEVTANVIKAKDELTQQSQFVETLLVKIGKGLSGTDLAASVNLLNKEKEITAARSETNGANYASSALGSLLGIQARLGDLMENNTESNIFNAKVTGYVTATVVDNRKFYANQTKRDNEIALYNTRLDNVIALEQARGNAGYDIPREDINATLAQLRSEIVTAINKTKVPIGDEFAQQYEDHTEFGAYRSDAGALGLTLDEPEMNKAVKLSTR
jgi:hypothetical protein